MANQVVNPVVAVKMPKKRGTRMAYSEGTIGADVNKRNYLSYLTKQYDTFREADASFGSFRSFHYSVIHKNIETEFGNSGPNAAYAWSQQGDSNWVFRLVRSAARGRSSETIDFRAAGVLTRQVTS